jgi:hypothetical protein
MAEEEIRSQKWVDKIEVLVREAQSISDPAARNITIDLLRAVLDFHAAGLERILDTIFESGPAGELIIEKIAADEIAGSMLLLHDMHPDDLETRLNRAVVRLQDMFASVGAKLSLVSVEPGTVHVRFESERTWSAVPVRASIEKVIFQAAPEIATVVLEGLKDTPPNGFVPVSDLLASSSV